MSWTYVGSIYSGRDKVRSLIGDTNADDPIVQDHEIAAMLAAYPNETEASAYLCASLATRFAIEGDLKVDGYDFQNIKKAEFFRDRSKELFKQSIGHSAPIALAVPSFGGVDVAPKDANKADTSVVQPSFYRGQFEHDYSDETTEDI
jgi:hypothetical protein